MNDGPVAEGTPTDSDARRKCIQVAALPPAIGAHERHGALRAVDVLVGHKNRLARFGRRTINLPPYAVRDGEILAGAPLILAVKIVLLQPLAGIPKRVIVAGL